MRKAFIFAFVLLLLFPATAFAAEDTDKYTGFIGQLPDSIKGAFATETIMLDIQASDGTSKIFGIKTEKGVIKESQEGAYPGSTMAIHISENVMEKMGSSTDPISVVKSEWGTGIRLEGLTFGNKIKLFFVDISARIFFFFGGGGTAGGAGSGGLPGGGQPPVVINGPENTKAACMDGMDNDRDGKTDCADAECDGLACTNIMISCPKGSTGGGPEKTCYKGVCNKFNYVCKETDCKDINDNDQDGKGDCADDDCDGQTCLTLPPPAGAAGGARIDKCASGTCKPGANPWTEINCNDGVDNDMDGGADVADYDCPYVDLKPTKVEYNGYEQANSSYFNNFKVYFKNIGTAATNGIWFWMELKDASDKSMGTCNYKALQANTEGSCTILSATNASSVKLNVDKNNAQPEADEKNNAAALDVQ